MRVGDSINVRIVGQPNIVKRAEIIRVGAEYGGWHMVTARLIRDIGSPTHLVYFASKRF